MMSGVSATAMMKQRVKVDIKDKTSERLAKAMKNKVSVMHSTFILKCTCD